MRGSAAITGVGCVTGFGIGWNVTWESLCAGHCAIRQNSPGTLGAGRSTAHAPGTADLANSLSLAGLSLPTRTTLLAKVAAREAWAMAGLGNSMDRDRLGLIINRYSGQHVVVSQYYQTLWDRGPSAVSGLQFVQSTANAVLGQVALEFQLRGPSLLNFGPLAFDHALDLLRQDKADVILTGAVDEFSEFAQAYFDAWELTPASLGLPEVMRTYSRSGPGFLGGDGSAFFVVENPTHAHERGAKVLGYLRGCSIVTDRAGPEDLASRHAEDIGETIRRALGDAGLEPPDVGMICGAANGLKGYDREELDSITSIFHNSPLLTAPKGALGETCGIAGAVGAMVTLLALKFGLIPPSVNSESREVDGNVSLVTGQPVALKKRTGLSLSYELSGQNCAYVFSYEQ